MTETQRHERAMLSGTHAHQPTLRTGLLERVGWILARWAGPAVPVLILTSMGYRQRWVTEDAFISLRVVEQILAGNGPVFNQGERVEAYTHPLWVAILAVWGGLGLPTAQGSVILGITLSIVGLVAALAAASRLADRTRWALPHPVGADPVSVRELTLPVGAIIFVTIPVVWDFVTSGLETGLSFAWLGVSFWLLARACFDREPRHRRTAATIGSAVVIGLGPLVRPDLAIFSAGFLLALIVCSSEQARRGWLRRATVLGAAAASLPLAYQVFRMGYFATLVPNTALAKEASVARWSQGWIYLRDFIDPYHLWLPLLIAAGFIGLLARRAWHSADRPALIVMTAPVASALLHAVYVVRVGGDFMHGRFLLPTLFGLLLPVMLIRVPFSPRPVKQAAIVSAALLVVAVWSVAAAIWLRIPYQQWVSDDGLADERGVYVANSGQSNPIELDDYMQMRQPWPRDGRAWHDLARGRPRVLIIDAEQYPLAPAVDANIAVVALAWNVGLAGYAAGIDVHIADRLGLGDPIASRLRLEERGRPGHEKELPPVWTLARFSTADGSAGDTNEVAAARTALACGEVEALLDAIEEPMSAGRFVDNLFMAWSLHDLRIPPDPATAADELC